MAAHSSVLDMLRTVLVRGQVEATDSQTLFSPVVHPPKKRSPSLNQRRRAACSSVPARPGNSSLGEIIPCNRQVSAKSAMRESRARIHDFIDKVTGGSSSSPRSFVCNPFSPPPEYSYRPENCSEGEIRPEDIPQILGGHACSIGDDRACGILTYAAAAQSLLSLFPTLEELASCRPVREAFAGVVSGHCGPLERSSRMALAGIAALATTMVFLVLAWATAASQDCKHHTSNVSNHCQRQEMGSPAQSPA
ncbi:unnamed protein product [Spirodela intermedia]|uniref:Uncharacterized protein n=1 Tax=Spirodela intermedia TaxID=51605 RepID=A0A7I8IRY3_SPIIN|nr:unnamed protein product [Spirodela intermedia]CAA6660297.1 unnamed protein product [Spirodela intermedia]